MFTVVMPQDGQQGSAVLAMIDSNANARQTRQGSMTHFGLLGDGSLTACTPPEPCGDTTSRSWDPNLTGPFNHAQYGGKKILYNCITRIIYLYSCQLICSFYTYMLVPFV